MPKISIQTNERIIPMVYAYSTPEIKRHDGWLKIGYTDKQTVEERVYQQGRTIDVKQKIEWKGSAVFDDGTAQTFRDGDFRAYLRKLGVEIMPSLEYCHISAPDSLNRFYEYRSNHGIIQEGQYESATPYTLREEQERCVKATEEYYKAHPKSEYLWNCKPRFGKTLTAYDFIKRVGAKSVLIVTNRPAIANSWYSDYEKFLGLESHYWFVSNVDAIKGEALVKSYDEYESDRRSRLSRSEYEDVDPMGLIEFVSLQDLKGAYEFGGAFNKLEHLSKLRWDVLIVDEAHEGIDTRRTDVAFDRINRKFTLHLSGTPFKALANEKFPEEAIFNWTYTEEQTAKKDWDKESSNPYMDLPRLNLLTYQMSEIIRDELSQGIEIQGETAEYAFDLNEFFSTNATGAFVYNESVDRFLDALTSQVKFPFSTPELRQEIRHSLWLLNRVDSAKALARKLEKHPVFKDYKLVLAVGDGRQDENDPRETQKAYDRVQDAIKESKYTITLSVGQLTTGVTVPEWTAVLMLSNVKSPALYMQAAFRAQNPCTFYRDKQYFRKENAYVFDFDPARTLDIYEQFANDLSNDTSAGRGDVEKRKKHIRELLNFFPVLGEDDDGEMIPLDAEKVLSVPRKIRCQEVVRRGFMSDFLFQNVANVFHAPQIVKDIINQFTAVKDSKNKVEVKPDTAKELGLDENNEVNVSDEVVIGTANDLFGRKIYAPEDLGNAFSVEPYTEVPKREDAIEHQAHILKKELHESTISQLVKDAASNQNLKMRQSTKNRIETSLKKKADTAIDDAVQSYKLINRELEKERDGMLELAQTEAEREETRADYEEKLQQNTENLNQNVLNAIQGLVNTAKEDIARTLETEKREQEKKTKEDEVKDHLRGFSRTIPSFLMAYGNDTVTLQTFETIIPPEVFLEVTSITIEQFIFLRDGGEYKDAATGEVKQFKGHIFEPVVFDDSIKEFLRLKEKLANYFEESSKEDIFDYIPPQKTNQIFTPKWVVKKMVDMLEEENPGCFNLPDKTFADLYMKSGLYIAEIVKRLYQSEGLKKAFPDRNERLHHIFAKQVYGLAPTEIIYSIAKNFILGFDKDVTITDHHLRLLDSLEYAKDGTLEAELDKAFGNT